jgi:hypothetical protein
MHFVISATWGPTDPTRAMLPFGFAASAVQAGGEVTLMLLHDAVYMAVEGAGAKLVPVGAAQPLRRGRCPRKGDAVGLQALRGGARARRRRARSAHQARRHERFPRRREAAGCANDRLSRVRYGDRAAV